MDRTAQLNVIKAGEMMDLNTRYFFYDLFFSMFVREPDDGVIDAWRRGLMTVRQAHPEDEVIHASSPLLEILHEENANESVRGEFVRLFWLPTGPAVSVHASRYVDGRPFGEYLVRMRTFLEKTSFRKREDYSEPEDTLAFHLDLMRSFIQEENEAQSTQEKGKWRARQRELVNDFMIAWIDQPLLALIQRDGEPVYSEIALLMRRFVQGEREMFLEQSAAPGE